MKSLLLPLGLWVLCGALPLAADPEKEMWQAIMDLPTGTIPEPTEEAVVWRTDFQAALAEAEKTGRPILVTWRCLPCKQCADFDKEVLEGSPKLTPLLQRFVTVRMTDAAQLDERYFPYRDFQDLDLSWWGYFLSSKGELYGVFGGKDHVSDSTRISEAAFVNSLQRVLAHHYDPRRENWGIDGPAPNTQAQASGPKDIASFETLKEKRPYFAKQQCVHCHQVGDILNFDAMQKGMFDMAKFTQPWPFPENVGLVVDRDDGLLVTQVEPGSAAAQAGMEPGDRLAMAERRRLFGQADFRGVLHRAPYGDASILVGWTRDGAPHFTKLKLKDGWRKTEIAWRKSVYDGIVGPHFGFFPIKGPNQGKGSMSFRPFMGPGNKVQQNSWYGKGLRPNMEIVSVNGRKDDWDSRELIAWFRLNHKAGDKIELEVRQGGQIKKITGRATSPHD